MEPKLLSVLFILFVQLGKLTFHKALLRKAIFAELIKICLGQQKMHKTITDDDEAADQTLHDDQNNINKENRLSCWHCWHQHCCLEK